MKKTYHAPKVEELGRFESMTKSLNRGQRPDGNFTGIVAPLILS